MAAGIQDVLLMKIIANVSQNIVKCSLHVSRTLGGNQPRVPIIFEATYGGKRSPITLQSQYAPSCCLENIASRL